MDAQFGRSSVRTIQDRSRRGSRAQTRDASYPREAFPDALSTFHLRH